MPERVVILQNTCLVAHRTTLVPERKATLGRPDPHHGIRMDATQRSGEFLRQNHQGGTKRHLEHTTERGIHTSAYREQCIEPSRWHA